MRNGLTPSDRSVKMSEIESFDNIHRYFDDAFQTVAVKILPGEFYVTRQSEMITTVLGSCVSACVRDKEFGIGGMNHFMLPETAVSRLRMKQDDLASSSLRYGNVAMEHLINTILKSGGKRKNLEVKLFGGAQVLQMQGDIGERNVKFVLDYVDIEALSLVSHDLGGNYPRKIVFFPQTGLARMKKLPETYSETIIQRERQYSRVVKNIPTSGGIELF